MPTRTTATTATFAAYVATIPAANYLVTHYGAVPVGLGLAAPAGVFTVGLALVLRDLLHERAGRWPVLAAIATGTLLSYLLAAPALATASAAAFGLAELADMAVYTPLRRRGLIPAVLASNAVGLVIDSALFLWLAFGNLAYLPGQIVAKTEMTLLAVAVLWFLDKRRTARTPVLDACDCPPATLKPCGHCQHDECLDCHQCSGAGCKHRCPAISRVTG